MDFKRENQNVEFLFKQIPRLNGMSAFPPTVSQKHGNYLWFKVTIISDKCTVDPEHVVISLTRLKDIFVERGKKKVSLPIYAVLFVILLEHFLGEGIRFEI